MKKNLNVIKLIEKAINDLRPYINMEGGDIEFVKYIDNIVYVKLTGACKECMFSDDTLKNGVYETLKKDIPEIEGVINVDI